MCSEAQTNKATRHVSVMPQEVIEALSAAAGGAYLDCTLGGAGHTAGILRANPANQVTSIDRDARALARAKEKLKEFGDRAQLFQATFSSIPKVVQGRRFNGAIADLGLSTDQLYENRGFSFNDDGPLDMRMDESSDLTAADIVNNYSESDIYRLLREGGVGPEARQIAHAIMRERPINTPKQLSQLVNSLSFAKKSAKKSNPSTVVFQALRIAVNKEFEEINRLLEIAPELVADGGRLAVITFHSLEDKLVTSAMRKWEGRDSMPALWPGSKTEKVFGKLLTKKPIVPSAQELEENPSSRSARLRVFEFHGV